MRAVFVKPKKDTVIRNPDTFVKLPETGGLVDPNNSYWARRIADGDVEVTEAPTEETPDSARIESTQKTRGNK